MSSSPFEFVVWTLTKVPGGKSLGKKNQKPIGCISVIWLSSFQNSFSYLYTLCYHGLYILHYDC